MITKIVAVTICIALLAGNSYGQDNTQQNSQQLKLEYVQKIEKYRKMRGAGATLTVVGSILVVAGIATAYSSSDDYNYNYDEFERGLGLVVAGYACLGPGVPLWIVGGIQHKKYSEKLNGLSIHVNATPEARGLTLRYRF